MQQQWGLSGNSLKLIAAAAMVVDHVGLLFFPRIPAFRIAGRLAFPIFAYMIAEGCQYTGNKRRHFLGIALLAALCQLAYFLFARSLYLSILVTFSLSILVIYTLQRLKAGPSLPNFVLLALTVAAVYCLNRVLHIDYGFWGCMTAAFPAALQGTRFDRVPFRAAALSLGLVLTAWSIGGIQWYALLALPLLLCYNGRRGKWRMKYFFYIFYPAHLVLLEGLYLLQFGKID